MRIVIMADGKGTRWSEYMGMPKHLASIEGEMIIARTVRLIRALDPENRHEIIITSHDPRYDLEGAERVEPISNIYEIDRFTEELICDDMCFLYGDTYYTEESVETILSTETDGTMFFGNENSIVAIRIKDSSKFREHKARVKDLYLAGRLDECKGWQVYRSMTGQSFDGEVQLDKDFIRTDKDTMDINTPEEYSERLR